jgi:hypothetical protein
LPCCQNHNFLLFAGFAACCIQHSRGLQEGASMDDLRSPSATSTLLRSASFSSSLAPPPLPRIPSTRARPTAPKALASRRPSSSHERLYGSHTISSSRVLDWQTQGGATWGLKGKQSVGHVNWAQLLARLEAQSEFEHHKLRRRMQREIAGDDERLEDESLGSEADHKLEDSAQVAKGTKADDRTLSRSLSSLSSSSIGPPQPPGFSRSQSNAGLFEWRSPASRLPRKLNHLTAGKPKREWSCAVSERSFTPPTNAWQGGKHGGKWSW